MPGLTSLSKSLVSRLGERRSQVCLLELDGEDKPLGDYMVFQYFPETITDTKAINYEAKAIPGGSLPLYQWTSSGERLISFEAIFTADVDLAGDTAAFAKLVSKGQSRRNVDLRTALLWLRRYMYPRYGDEAQLGVPLTQAPRKSVLYIPNSGIGLTSGAYSSTTDSILARGPSQNGVQVSLDRVLVIMTQCDITYEAFFTSGLPRIASVQLQFAQIAQLGGEVNFPRDADTLRDAVTGGSEAFNVFPYPIKAKFT